MSNKNSEKILVAGGAGYIGSHMLRVLIEAGLSPVVIDNLSTGYRDFVPKEVPFYKADLRDPGAFFELFKDHRISAVMYFASHIEVGESVVDPLKYYDNNLVSCINLIKVMKEHCIDSIVFSSTAAVYGNPEHVPVNENSPLVPNNPYGYSKLMMERMLSDAGAAYGLKCVFLRYFNVAGALPGAGIGEKHVPETHLIPNVLRSIKDDTFEFRIFGDDYSTFDGTCVRDYIHVVDLCEAHLKSLRYLKKNNRGIFNLGSGKGFSVREVLEAVEKVTGRKIMSKVLPRREGDPEKLVAFIEKAQNILNWNPKYTLEDMIRTAWEWEKGSSRNI